MDPFAVPRATFELSMRLATLPFEIGAKMLGARNDDEPGEERPARSTPSGGRSSASTRGRPDEHAQARQRADEAQVDAVDPAAPPRGDRGGEAHDAERRRAQEPAPQHRSVLPAQDPAPEQRRVV